MEASVALGRGLTMIRHKQFTTGSGRSGAGKYFTEHLSVSAYYANGVGLLQGQAFERVGMQVREVDLEVFSALEQNLNPETGEKLTPRTNKTRKEWWSSDSKWTKTNVKPTTESIFLCCEDRCACLASQPIRLS
jgi:hypothetical protein